MTRRSVVSGLIFVTALLSGGASRAKPGDAEGLRRKASALRAEAARLGELGRDDDARPGTDDPGGELGPLNALLRERVKRLQEIERRIRNPNGDPSVRGLRAEIADIKREIARLESERSHAGKAEEAARRVRHMRVAAEHLQEAGMLDLAGQVLLRAAAIETGPVEPAPPPPPAPADEVRELRREVERIRAELDAVRKTVRPEP